MGPKTGHGSPRSEILATPLNVGYAYAGNVQENMVRVMVNAGNCYHPCRAGAVPVMLFEESCISYTEYRHSIQRRGSTQPYFHSASWPKSNPRTLAQTQHTAQGSTQP